MHFGQELDIEQQRHDSLAALKELVRAAAAASGARMVSLISVHNDAGERLVVATSDNSLPEGTVDYQAKDADVQLELSYRGRLLGYLVFTGLPPEVNRPVLDAYASSAGFILGYGDDLLVLARTAEESRVLRELGMQLGQPTELSQLLRSTVDSVRQLLRADYAAIGTGALDGTSRWIAMSGNRTNSFEHVVFAPGHGMTARVMASHKPSIVEDFRSLGYTTPQSFSKEFPVHAAEGGVSALAVPLMRGGQPLGAVIVGSRRPRKWSEHEIELAGVLGNGVAVAVSQVQESAAERAQRAFFEKVIEDFPGVLVVLAPPDFRVVRANSRLSKSLPEPYRSGEPVVGRTLRELTPNEGNERSESMMSVLRSVAESGEAISVQQYAALDPVTGETKYWNWTAAPVGGEGDQRMVILIAQDITELVGARQKEQQSAETARARAEELETVVLQMVDGVVIFNSQGEVVRSNPASETLLGRGLEPGAKPRSFPELYGLFTLNNEPYDPEQLPASKALKGETVTGAQLMVKRPDGDEAILSVSAAPLKDSDGVITGAVTVLRDITEDKLAERLKDEFLSVVSHELRTPLSAIMGYSDLMLRGVHGGLSERQARSLGAVKSNAERLLHLINDLLDVSRLESGVVPLDLRPTNLSEALSHIIAQTRVLAVNAGLSIRNEVPDEGVPLVLADDQRVQQIIENLLSNAIKFTPKGGSIIFRAEMSPLPADHEAVFDAKRAVDQGTARSMIVSVTDTGVGLQQEQLERIWDRFYQVDTSAKRKSGGVGLGLAIVRSLVELHGGQIRAESPGVSRGTSFMFTLPIAGLPPEVVESPDLLPGGVSLVRGAEDPNARAVLVVEDDADQREIICDMLEMEGYRVILAGDGEQAVNLAITLRPSAIALDVMLPRSDGWEVLTRLKTDERTRDIPVLIISVVDQQEFGRRLGADEYLVKPLEPASLRAIVRRLVYAGEQKR